MHGDNKGHTKGTEGKRGSDKAAERQSGKVLGTCSPTVKEGARVRHSKNSGVGLAAKAGKGLEREDAKIAKEGESEARNANCSPPYPQSLARENVLFGANRHGAWFRIKGGGKQGRRHGGTEAGSELRDHRGWGVTRSGPGGGGEKGRRGTEAAAFGVRGSALVRTAAPDLSAPPHPLPPHLNRSHAAQTAQAVVETPRRPRKRRHRQRR